jgi:hypothetical protein
MTKLERHCRLLLHAYPAHYRRQRADEMLGTLLETTPTGRTWPRGRDIRGLLAGGLQARAALNRRLPLRTNVRTAVLVGLAAFLGYNAVATLSVYWYSEYRLDHLVHHGAGPAQTFDWAPVVSPALILITVALAWVSRKRVIVLAGAIPALVNSAVAASLLPIVDPWAATSSGSINGIESCRLELATTCDHLEHAFGHYFGTGQWYEIVWFGCLAGLVAVAGGDEHPGRRWIWPVALVSLSPALLTWSSEAIVQVVTVLLVTIGVVSIAWIVVDARPAIATAVFLLALGLQAGVDYVYAAPMDLAAPFLIVGAGAAVAVWRLRRQSGRAPQRHATARPVVWSTRGWRSGAGSPWE